VAAGVRRYRLPGHEVDELVARLQAQPRANPASVGQPSLRRPAPAALLSPWPRDLSLLVGPVVMDGNGVVEEFLVIQALDRPELRECPLLNMSFAGYTGRTSLRGDRRVTGPGSRAERRS
jgi:hypothetical protein